MAMPLHQSIRLGTYLFKQKLLRRERFPILVELEPLFAEGRIDLLDHQQLVKELKCLERRLRTGGRVLIDHPHGGHDDYATAVALASVAARQERASTLSPMQILLAGHDQDAEPDRELVFRPPPLF